MPICPELLSVHGRHKRHARTGRRAATTTALSVALALGSGNTFAPASAHGDRASSSAGSADVGDAEYSVPSGARFVSPSGSNSASGSSGSPWRTLAHAVSRASSGTTIILRGGTYHESVTVPSDKRLAIQAYPDEAVWLDGSKVLSSWRSDGRLWRHDGWTHRFDASASYTSGSSGGGADYFRFVDSDYRMAAHPEQLFVDGVAQRQVGSKSSVVPGTFWVDKSNSRLYMGSSPSGRQVRASVLTTALSVRGAGSKVRGIGVRRYATSLPLMGTVRLLAKDVTLENAVVQDNATQGVFVNKSGARLNKVTSQRNGSMGMAAVYADGMQIRRVKIVDNNVERFNKAPAAGGFKITRSRDLSFRDSVFRDNRGTGLWLDESVYDVTVIGNDLIGNKSHGISFEISSKAVIADNVVANNAGQGLKINNATGVSIWNNTLVGNGGRAIWLVQDRRLAKHTSMHGHDRRQPLPDPTVTWVLRNLAVHNNVISGGSSNKALLQLQDDALDRTAGEIGIVANGNAYHRPSSSSPSYAVIWASGRSDPYVYTSVSKFRSGTRQESRGREFTGAAVVDFAHHHPTSALRSVVSSTATPLPTSIATLTGQSAGERHVGAWTD